MLRHATAKPAVINRVKHKSHPQDFTVLSCPDDTYPRGATFSETAVKLGLQLCDGARAWPDGMVFVKRTARYIVRGGKLVNEEGGQCRG
jgi:hypothetical protein